MARMIKQADYNSAKDILKKAGSKTAEKSHKKHAKDNSVDEDHGKAMLCEARDEFRASDKKEPDLKSEMTKAHYDAVHAAAKKMGITRW